MRKLAFVALAAGLLVGCPGADDADDSANPTSNADSSQPTTSTAASAGEDTDALACPFNHPSETTDGSSDPLMQTWGAPCTSNAECVALIGEGAECLFKAVIYELPEGFCTKPCNLPDGETTVVVDHEECDPAGGVACVGQRPLFEYCAVPCTDDAQCNRDGYYCRSMPLISQPSDPTFCLMPDCCEDNC